MSSNFAAEWGAALTAPFTEESSKAAGFVLLMVLAPRLIRSAYDGFVVGAFIGLGFQVFDDWVYTLMAPAADLGTNQLQSVVQTFLSRGIVTGLVSHAVFSAIVCIGIVWLVGRPGEPRRPLLGLGFIVVGVVSHGAFDRAAVFSDIPLLVVISLLPLAAIFLGVRWAAQQERTWMHDLLAPEVAKGTLTDDDLGARARQNYPLDKFDQIFHSRPESGEGPRSDEGSWVSAPAASGDGLQDVLEERDGLLGVLRTTEDELLQRQAVEGGEDQSGPAGSALQPDALEHAGDYLHLLLVEGLDLGQEVRPPASLQGELELERLRVGQFRGQPGQVASEVFQPAASGLERRADDRLPRRLDRRLMDEVVTRSEVVGHQPVGQARVAGDRSVGEAADPFASDDARRSVQQRIATLAIGRMRVGLRGGYPDERSDGPPELVR